MAIDRLVTIANGKGGVGKTSVATNLAGLAAAADQPTLFIDLDTQGDGGDDLGYNWRDQSDEGQHLVGALLGGRELTPFLRQVRPNLDVIPGGEALEDLSAALAGRTQRYKPIQHLLADALAPIVADYALIVVDTPPKTPTLLQLALGAARWIVIPTRSDRSSIKGLQRLATQIGDALQHNPDLQILGAALFASSSSAKVVRREAQQDISDVLGAHAPLFETVVRYAEKSAVKAREEGLLIHELAEQVEDAEPFWIALRDGRRPERKADSAPSLAEDYALLCHEIITRIASAEGHNQEEAS